MPAHDHQLLRRDWACQHLPALEDRQEEVSGWASCTHTAVDDAGAARHGTGRLARVEKHHHVGLAQGHAEH